MLKLEIVTTLLTALIAGLIPGAILGMSHYFTKRFRWGNVTRYTYGCFWVFWGGSGFTIWYIEVLGGRSALALVGGWWLILAICGTFVATAYKLDEQESLARQKEVAQNSGDEISIGDTR